MNVAEAKAKLSELISRAEAGEEVEIARDGVPAVRLTPVRAASPVRIGALAHLGDLEKAEAALDDDDPTGWGEEFTLTDPLKSAL